MPRGRPPAAPGARAWCLTLNLKEYEPGTGGTMLTLGTARYVIWQVEQGAAGTYHLQGYVEFHETKRMPAVKNWVGDNTVHLETRCGTREEARDYCKKDDTRVEGPWELGDFGAGGQGRRSDSALAVEILRAGGLKRMLTDAPEFLLKHPKQCKEFLSIVNACDKHYRDVEVIWIQGPTNIGKSWHAFELAHELGLDY